MRYFLFFVGLITVAFLLGWNAESYEQHMNQCRQSYTEELCQYYLK